MKRLIGRRLRDLANRLDPPPKITIHCGAEPRVDVDAIMAGIRRSARLSGLRSVL